MAFRDQVIRLGIIVLLAVNVYFAAKEPCTSAEGAVYERYASRPVIEMWKAPFDPGLGAVYGILARTATRTGGVSELTIRVPAILGGVLFWTGLSYFLRKRLGGWQAILVFALITANPWTFRAFSTASGAALAAGLLATAARLADKHRTCAIWVIGLAIGSDARLALPALAAASLAAFFLRMDFWKWMDELLIPGLMAGLVLLLPGLFATEKLVAPASDDRGTAELIRTLMRQPRDNAFVRVGASPSLEPGVFFYRRRYHLDWILLGGLDTNEDFYILASSDQAPGTRSELRVIQRVSKAALVARAGNLW